MLKLQVIFILFLSFHIDAQLVEYGFNRAVDIVNKFTGNLLNFGDNSNSQKLNNQPQPVYTQNSNNQLVDEKIQTPQNNFYTSSQCGDIFSLRQDQNGVVFGLVTITNADYIRNDLRVELSLAAKLIGVRVETL